jgi:hypothetical protein
VAAMKVRIFIWFVCRVTGARRFPPPSHATSFEIFSGLGFSFLLTPILWRFPCNMDLAAQQLVREIRSEE